MSGIGRAKVAKPDDSRASSYVFSGKIMHKVGFCSIHYLQLATRRLDKLLTEDWQAGRQKDNILTWRSTLSCTNFSSSGCSFFSAALSLSSNSLSGFCVVSTPSPRVLSLVAYLSMLETAISKVNFSLHIYRGVGTILGRSEKLINCQFGAHKAKGLKEAVAYEMRLSLCGN